MVALEFLTVSLELRHEVGAGVPIIANPWLMACSKPRDAGFEAGRHTPPRKVARRRCRFWASTGVRSSSSSMRGLVSSSFLRSRTPLA